MRYLRIAAPYLLAIVTTSIFACLAGAQSSATPTITKLNPSTVVAGGPAMTLTVTGTNFTSKTEVFFGAAPVPTTFNSATSLTASVPAKALEVPKSVPVCVTGSKTVPFTITPAPVPTIANLSPSSIASGSQAFKLTVTGTNFTRESQIYFGLWSPKTTYVSATSVTATIPAEALITARTVNVVVGNGGGNHTQAAQFVVTGASVTAPTISNISPATTVATSAAFLLTVTGTNYTSSSTIYFGRNALTTDYVSATQLTATVPADLLYRPVTLDVFVGNGGGNHSGTATFAITPAPAVVTYFVGPSSVASDDGVSMRDTIDANTALDMTQPASVVLDTVSQSTGSDTVVYDTGDVTLKSVAATGTTSGTVYAYKSDNLVMRVVCLPDNVYQVNIEATALDLSTINLADQVTITVNLGGQSFVQTANPITQKS